MHSGLPAGVSTFIGREHERAALRELVARERVVTLTGSGGCGKTRLALEVARDVSSQFDDGGVFWVELQGVSDPSMVVTTVSGAPGVRERPGRGLLETLTEELSEVHGLLVLDNCEHLVEECAEVVGALSSKCPHLHVLATSRVPLAVGGEATFALAPLRVPAVDADSTGTVATADAARLFEVRARQVRPEFRIDEGNAAAVTEICRRLDGIPLAIELAAARIRVLSPVQIADRLSNRFGLLTAGVRGAPERQKTLEASVDWSYDLLDDTQRLVLARLSVFAGSFELDAAEAVVSGDGIEERDVLELVAGLVEQSLLEVIERGGHSRYRLLETISAYAWQKLEELDSVERLRQRHLGFQIELAGRAGKGLSSGDPLPWTDRLTSDLDELRSAMSWAVEAGDLGGLADLTEPIVRFWYGRGLSREVLARLLSTVDVKGASPEERIRCLVVAAPVAMDAMDNLSGFRAADEAVGIARGTDVGVALAQALANRSFLGAVTGQLSNEQVLADAEEAVALVEQVEDASTRAFVLAWAAGAVCISGTIDGAAQLAEQSLEECVANDLVFQLPSAHVNLATWQMWSGRLGTVRHHAARAVELSRQVRRAGWEVSGLRHLGGVALLEGDHARARELFSEAGEVLRSHGLEGTLYGFLGCEFPALLGYASGDLGSGQEAARWAVEVGRAGGGRHAEALGEWLLGVMDLAAGVVADARGHLEASRQLSTDPRIPLPYGRCLLGLASLARDEQNTEEAWELAHESLGVLFEYGDRIGAATALEAISDVAVELGDPDLALRLLGASESFHQETGIVRFPLEAERLDRARTAAAAGLDERDAAACWESGRSLALEEAVAHARRGRGKRGRPQTGWGSLTPAERDVVRLVAEGRSNAEIGARLFISLNTVKTHLTHVYAKVDVDGRADLAAQVARRGL